MDQKISYPTPLYGPGKKYPEMPFKIALPGNEVCDNLRKLFFWLDFDKKHFSQKGWNPLSEFISPGQTVLIKPSMVRHIHLAGGDINSVITHGSIIRCITDYVYLALKGRGKIIIGDAPLQSADFNAIKKINNIEEMADIYQRNGFRIEIKDFRREISTIDETHYFLKREKSYGDNLGYTVINLGKESLFNEISRHYLRYRVTNYDKKMMRQHHNRFKNEYLIPNTVLQADVIINLPKLKTHRKAGITCALKNFIGINGNKDWIPHHRFGSIAEGGDEYLKKNIFKRITTSLTEFEDVSQTIFMQRLFRVLKIPFKYLVFINDDHIREGNWYGNYTLWRSILDLNRIALYADKNGRLRESAQRKIFTVVDGIIAGEGEGPLAAKPKKCGTLIVGFNNVGIDLVAATLMGFNYKNIPQIENSFRPMKYPLISAAFNNLRIILNGKECNLDNLKRTNLGFIAPVGWKKHIEISKT